jgi:hypothetical protein
MRIYIRSLPPQKREKRWEELENTYFSYRRTVSREYFIRHRF